MRDVLRALNELVAQGLIQNYAIGGAIGASFYVDALQTEDVDAFIFLPSASSGLVLLTPIYTALTQMGGVVEREYVRFGEWPLQILTDGNALITDAILNALEVQFDGIPTRVFQPEHLCAIALQTGRAKDYFRVKMFVQQDVVDKSKLKKLVETYGLEARWNRALTV